MMTTLIETNEDLGLSETQQILEELRRENSQLKEDKVELLTQLKQAYSSLDHKDEEMRQMMLDYREHMIEADETIHRLTNAKADAERMRWMLLSKAKVATDQVLGVQARLEHVSALLADRDKQLAELNAHLQQLREKRNHDSVDSGLKSLGLDLLSRNPSPASPDDTPACPPPDGDVMPAGSVGDLAGAKRRRQWSARRLSQVFTRTRTRSAVYSSSTSLNSDRDRTAEQAASEASMKTVMSHAVTEWRAGDVHTWVVRVLGMTQYGRAVADNIKSGAVLLQLKDSDMEKTLAIKDALHRRKLRLAIDELRTALDNGTVGYHSNLASMSHDWVAHSWLCDLGLGQYSITFDLHLVDGRVLSSLTRGDLDKHLGIHQTCHVNSILMGVQLLRMVNFDRQELERRRLAHPEDASLWTNSQCINWLVSIDLTEYTEQARSVGLHGAVLMLDAKDASASADTLASLLHISQNKALVRKHLTAEFDKLKGKASGTNEQTGGDSSTLQSQVTLRRQPASVAPCDNGSSEGGESQGRLVKTASGRKKRNWRNSIGHLFSRKTTDFADCAEQEVPPSDSAVPVT